MNFAELMLLAIVAVLGSLLIARQYYAAEARKRVSADPEADRLRDEVRQLRERVQVLERVVTDTHSTADLGSRIERLRD